MVNKEFFLALDVLEQEKHIDKQLFLNTLRDALVKAYSKQNNGGAKDIEIDLDPEKCQIRFFTCLTVVEEVMDPDKEISLENAKAIKKTATLGSKIKTEFKPKDFSRVAAQNAKQLITQKIREAEKTNTLAEFEDKENEIKMCTIRRVDAKNVYVEIGSGEIEAVINEKDQVKTERYTPGNKMMVYVKKVKTAGKNASIMVSRAAPGLVKKLFENEVPEIANGIVEIKSIARDPGLRTKIAIVSHDDQVDAIGACVGNKGSRVNSIVDELNGEKIDIILWSENPLEFIAKALSPAKVLKVSAPQTGEQRATVIVPDDKLSLAIGKDGQNARLAAKLTNWKIDVKSESRAAQEIQNSEEYKEESVENESTFNNENETEEILNSIDEFNEIDNGLDLDSFDPDVNLENKDE